ncbi:MAG: Mur ligase [Lysobacteraceae bacterium]|nr:MAG: Mur ligase [Xanthomonadaceae bacterium]
MGGREPRRARDLHLAGERRLNATVSSAPTPPFEDSRRLTGPNLYFARSGAVLETLGPHARAPHAQAEWREHIAAICAALGWPAPVVVVRAHASGASLALTAAEDALFTATEINEWAWCRAVGFGDFHAPGHPAIHDLAQATETLRRFEADERRPRMTALLAAARAHDVPALYDDDALSIGLGRHGRTWTLDALPDPDDVPWDALGAIPAALVTGSNGKTTTVRLIAAMLRAHGLRTAHSCTDGLFVGGETAIERLVSGDYSGPAGARQLLRRNDVAAAVLETARGGIMRRGLALTRADVAVVTNISADHFGEYGIHALEDLAAAKLVVAQALIRDAGERGWLVTNADDPLLREHAPRTARAAWFYAQPSAGGEATQARDALLAGCLTRGIPTCGAVAGRLLLWDGAAHIDLGAIAAMPLSMGGVAGYNIANLAGAALAAHLMRVPVDIIHKVLREFGERREDNPGRLQRWRLGGVEVLLDYAHNPDGLTGLLEIAHSLRGAGRLALLLGQAGNREDAQIRELAGVAARYTPDLVVLKDIDGYLRGRGAGDVAAIIGDELRQCGIAQDALTTCLSEADAVRLTLRWSRPGDVLVLPVHGFAAKDEAAALLDALHARHWVPGQALPDPVP